MARARNIKPGFFESDQVGEVSFCARLLFIAMWQIADRCGRLERRPAKLRAYAFRYDALSVADVEAMLAELENAGLVKTTDLDGLSVLEIPTFNKHQTPHPKEPSLYEPRKVSALPPVEAQKPRKVSAHPPSHEEKPRKVSAFVDETGVEPPLNPESLLLNPDGADGAEPRKPQTAPPARPPAQPRLLDLDPQAEFRRLAGELVQLLPAAGDVHLTARQLEIEYSTSASFADDPVAFSDSVRESAKRWRKAWGQNPALRPKAAQWWLRDSDYARRPPEPAARQSSSMKRLIDYFPEVPDAG